MLLGAANRYNSGSVFIISENFDFHMPQENNMRFNNVKNGQLSSLNVELCWLSNGVNIPLTG